MSHDQNFKNLILDYPRQALAFFAAEEAVSIDPEARILPVRQEQLQARLGENYRELDVPLLVEWPDGHRACILFALEHETDPRRFSIHRLGHYVLHLSEMYQTQRVVPVVVFVKPGGFASELRIGGEINDYLQFRYLSCALSQIAYEDYRGSDNLVARLNLPNLKHRPDQRLAVYADAVRGLSDLESDPRKRMKYLDFIDIYAALDDNERERFQTEYAEEAENMSRFAERFRQEGMEQGIRQGMQQGMQQGIDLGTEQGVRLGESRILIRQLRQRFGALPSEALQRIEQASEAELERWSTRVLAARSLDEIFA